MEYQIGRVEVNTRHRKRGVFCRCVDCQEIISNPVCPECLAMQMKIMVSETNSKLAKDISATHIDGESTCIRCGNTMGLCAHCFSKDVYYQLLEKDENVAEEFLSRFDYELRVSLI